MPAKKITGSFMMSSFSCVIMASGLGIRFGGNKLMADFGGSPMVHWILEASQMCFDEVVVVTRNTGVENLCNTRGIKVITHEFPYRSDTVRLGVKSLDVNTSGVVFCLADQPFLSVDTLLDFKEAVSNEPDKIWRTRSGNIIGSPTYFPVSLFEELASLPQDKGGSYLCKIHPELVREFNIQNPLELKDIDTKDTYEELLPQASCLNIWSKYLKSGKKHLFITGDRGEGKTTFLKSLLPLIGTNPQGLTSFATKGVDVRLRNRISGEEIIIGKFNPESRMSPLLEAFNGRGVEFIESLKVSSDKWVTIDEIGYLEESSDLYKNAIRELLEVKRVIAVVRKDGYPFLQELVNRDDAMVINIKRDSR